MKAKSQQQQLVMVVDLDERGSFRAHVDDQDGREVFSFSNEDENGWPEEEGVWLVEDGYMKHCRDCDGLHDYLLTVGLGKSGSTMRMEG